MGARQVISVLWPAFLAACLLQVVVFAIVDPSELAWFGRPMAWSRQAVYTASFFLFWACCTLASSMTAILAPRGRPNGYLTKESAPVQLVLAINKIAAGGAFVSAEVAEQLAPGAMPGAQAPAAHASLSDREFEVFRLLVAGVSVTDVAGRLNLSVKTVSTHKANLMQKMGLRNQTELVRYAIQRGLAEDL